jgi:hypothetical protein
VGENDVTYLTLGLVLLRHKLQKPSNDVAFERLKDWLFLPEIAARAGSPFGLRRSKISKCRVNFQCPPQRDLPAAYERARNRHVVDAGVCQYDRDASARFSFFDVMWDIPS